MAKQKTPGAANQDAGEDPAIALAKAAGLNPADLSDDDLNDLRASMEADAARDEDTATNTERKGDDARTLVPEASHNMQPHAISLLFEACDKFGISPYADQDPVELLAWRFYPGSDQPRKVTPDAVVLVTAGGLKIKHWDDPDWPMDPDTEERLRRIFQAFHIDPVTKRAVPDPLPDDLRLPVQHVTGEITSTEHQYPGGYLRAGGAAAADAKEQRREERSRRFGGRWPSAASWSRGGGLER